MARYKATEVKERAVDSSWFMPLVGAGIGALVGRAFASRAQDHRWHEESARWTTAPRAYERDWDRYPRDRWVDDEAAPTREGSGEEPGIADRAAELRDKASERATEIKDEVSARAGDVRERLRGQADSLREQASHLRERLPDRERLRSSAREDTALWAIGAMALGALFGFALPVSQRERELLEPAKRRVREAGQQAKDMALEKGGEMMDQASSKLGEHESQRPPGYEREHETASGALSPTPSTPPYH